MTKRKPKPGQVSPLSVDLSFDDLMHKIARVPKPVTVKKPDPQKIGL